MRKHIDAIDDMFAQTVCEPVPEDHLRQLFHEAFMLQEHRDKPTGLDPECAKLKRTLDCTVMKLRDELALVEHSLNAAYNSTQRASAPASPLTITREILPGLKEKKQKADELVSTSFG